MRHRALAATTAIAFVLGAFAAAEAEAATIFVNNDEWTFSNSGFEIAPAGTATFVSNLVGEMGPKIHAYSNNFGFTGDKLATAMSNAGATYTTGTGFDFTLPNISEYDAIFLGGFALDANGLTALSAYVAAGGNVYIAGGTANIAGGAAGEAAAWNGFLSPFGVQMQPTYAFIGSVAVSGDPLFDGVSGLYSNGGNPLTGPNVICCGETAGGRYAVYRTEDNGGGGPGPNPIPLPAAGWLLLGGVTSLAAVRRRRRA
jgi:hypothetical protein